MRKNGKTPDAPQAVGTIRTKAEWIECAATIAAERFEVAGALYDVRVDAQLSEGVVKQKVKTYKEGAN